MKFKAVTNRSLSFADETFRVIVEDTDTLESLKEKVLSAVEMADYRASELRQRLFEDTDLTDELKYEELQAARTMAKKLYPEVVLPKSPKVGTGAQFEFCKLMFGGEDLRIYISDFENDEDLRQAVKVIWDIIDSRLQYTNKRELDAGNYFKTLTMATRTKILNVMDILYGRAFKDSVIEKLQQMNVQEVVEGIRKDENYVS